MARVLVIDDDKALLRALKVALSAKGHEVLSSATAEEGLSVLALRSPDVVVLDLGLPDLDGLDVVHRIRSWSEVPVIVLSATALEDRKVAALDAGANDYVTKPFGMAELEARIRTALRHASAPAAPDEGLLTVGPIELDLVHYQVTVAGEPVELTAREFELLAFPGPPRRQDLHPPDGAAPGLGGQLRLRSGLLAGLCLPASQEAGEKRRPIAADLTRHRLLPLRRLNPPRPGRSGSFRNYSGSRAAVQILFRRCGPTLGPWLTFSQSSGSWSLPSRCSRSSRDWSTYELVSGDPPFRVHIGVRVPRGGAVQA